MSLDGADRVLITGATGFLGRYVVSAALRAGYTVRAVVRPGVDADRLPWQPQAHLELARVDLRSKRGLAEAVQGCDTVLHLAAAKSGDFYARFAGTVVATENLLDAMDRVGTRRMVLCSSFSVYSSHGVGRHRTLDEKARLESAPLKRDEYAQVKLLQERLVRDWADRSDGCQLTVLRPGLIYGPGELWNALIGIEIVPSLWLGPGWYTTLPLAWVENVADAFVCALRMSPLPPETLNIVDDSLPTIGQYVRAIRPLVDDAPRLIVLTYPLTRALVKMLDVANATLLGGRLKPPSGLSPAPFEARFRPHRYTNRKAREVLGWVPRHAFPETLQRARADEALLRVIDAGGLS